MESSIPHITAGETALHTSARPNPPTGKPHCSRRVVTSCGFCTSRAQEWTPLLPSCFYLANSLGWPCCFSRIFEVAQASYCVLGMLRLGFIRLQAELKFPFRYQFYLSARKRMIAMSQIVATSLGRAGCCANLQLLKPVTPEMPSAVKHRFIGGFTSGPQAELRFSLIMMDQPMPWAVDRLKVTSFCSQVLL